MFSDNDGFLELICDWVTVSALLQFLISITNTLLFKTEIVIPVFQVLFIIQLEE